MHGVKIITASRYLRSHAVLCSFLVLSLVGAAFGQQPSIFLKGPYLQGPGEDTMTIKWESPTNGAGVVRYGLEGKTDHELRVEIPRPLAAESYIAVTNVADNGETNITRRLATNQVYLYEARLNNLQEQSVYTYSVELNGARTTPKHFKTFGRHQPKVTFVAYADTRSNPQGHAAVAANFKRHSPDFILHMGDLVADGRRYELWGKEFFGPLVNVLDEIPILPSLGNHEQDGSKYLFYMHLPGKERWYSYEIGPVHMLALDFQFEKDNDEQFAFAEKDLLTAKTPWKIVFLHYPVFNIGGHATGWGHTTYLPLFHRAKVDLVIAGHSHIYERFRPIASSNGEGTWPITHITSGGGGAPLAKSYPHPALAAAAATNHFVLIEATATTLTGRTITTNNGVLDQFELKKPGGNPEPSYLAQVYPEEALKLAYEAVPSLTANLTAAPKTNAPAQAMFTIRPLKSIGDPLQLEITLTPESARYYSIEDGPLRVSSPTNGENKIVWARVGATANDSTDGLGGRLLSPPLMFQGTMKSGSLEAMAYGQRCRITDEAALAATKDASK